MAGSSTRLDQISLPDPGSPRRVVVRCIPRFRGTSSRRSKRREMGREVLGTWSRTTGSEVFIISLKFRLKAMTSVRKCLGYRCNPIARFDFRDCTVGKFQHQ